MNSLVNVTKGFVAFSPVTFLGSEFEKTYQDWHWTRRPTSNVIRFLSSWGLNCTITKAILYFFGKFSRYFCSTDLKTRRVKPQWCLKKSYQFHLMFTDLSYIISQERSSEVTWLHLSFLCFFSQEFLFIPSALNQLTGSQCLKELIYENISQGQKKLTSFHYLQRTQQNLRSASRRLFTHRVS